MSEYLKNSLRKNHVICIFEGNSEEAIIETLYNSNKLIFNSFDSVNDEGLIREFTQVRKAKNFSEKYLKRDYGDRPLNILRIVDSPNENFKLPKVYDEKIESREIEVFKIVTRPEIEILMIINEGKYHDYVRSSHGIKPSEYMKDLLKISNIKSKSFVCDYFGDVNRLIYCINEYKRLHSIGNNYCLSHLLR